MMQPFDWFVTGFFVFAGAERVYERQFSCRAVRGERRARWLYRALDLMLMVIYVGTVVEHFLRQKPMVWTVTTLGMAGFAAALLVRNAAIRALGQFWSLHLEIRERHELVTTGIYRYVRHPAYTAIMVEMISIPLVANSFVTAVVALVVYVPLILMRWRREEQAMIVKFDARYERYRREVPAFLPWRKTILRDETPK